MGFAAARANWRMGSKSTMNEMAHCGPICGQATLRFRRTLCASSSRSPSSDGAGYTRDDDTWLDVATCPCGKELDCGATSRSRNTCRLHDCTNGGATGALGVGHTPFLEWGAANVGCSQTINRAGTSRRYPAIQRVPIALLLQPLLLRSSAHADGATATTIPIEAGRIGSPVRRPCPDR